MTDWPMLVAAIVPSVFTTFVAIFYYGRTTQSVAYLREDVSELRKLVYASIQNANAIGSRPNTR